MKLTSTVPFLRQTESLLIALNCNHLLEIINQIDALLSRTCGSDDVIFLTPHTGWNGTLPGVV